MMKNSKYKYIKGFKQHLNKKDFKMFNGLLTIEVLDKLFSNVLCFKDNCFIFKYNGIFNEYFIKRFMDCKYNSRFFKIIDKDNKTIAFSDEINEFFNFSEAEETAIYNLIKLDNALDYNVIAPKVFSSRIGEDDTFKRVIDNDYS